jgi:hypothetical protein
MKVGLRPFCGVAAAVVREFVLVEGDETGGSVAHHPLGSGGGTKVNVNNGHEVGRVEVRR